MRLINTTTLKLEDFTLRQPPQYAILSHTWGNQEVLYEDMETLAPSRLSKSGYVKIVETCRLASERGLGYAWIDTCCIDKTKSAELAEAITSMFDYYARSEVCFAHLADLAPESMDIGSCRWFTRGWTLQELLAPQSVEFYNQAWEHVGSKHEFVERIARATNIKSAALKDPSRIKEYSVATRLSWSSNRQTTRLEDTAYCLLGIFDVSLPLIYGEGHNAFQRLLEAVVRRDNDLTVFAWKLTAVNNVDPEIGPGVNLLPQSPLAFDRSDNIVPLASDFPELTMTNRGLRVSPDIPLRVLSFASCRQDRFMAVQLGYIPGNPHQAIYLPLRKIGPGLFCRHRDIPLISSTEFPIVNEAWQDNTLNYHIVAQSIPRAVESFHCFRDHTIHVPHQPDAELVYAIPDRLWDPEDRVFLRPRAIDRTYFPVVLAMFFETASGHSVVVLCDNTTGVPSAGIVSDMSANTVMRLLFRGKQRENSLIWADFEALGVEVKYSSNAGLTRDKVGHGLLLEQSIPQLGFPPFRVSLHGRSGRSETGRSV